MHSLTWASLSHIKLAPSLGAELALIYPCLLHPCARPSKEERLAMVGEATKCLALQCEAIAQSRFRARRRLCKCMDDTDVTAMS